MTLGATCVLMGTILQTEGVPASEKLEMVNLFLTKGLGNTPPLILGLLTIARDVLLGTPNHFLEHIALASDSQEIATALIGGTLYNATVSQIGQAINATVFRSCESKEEMASLAEEAQHEFNMMAEECTK